VAQLLDDRTIGTEHLFQDLGRCCRFSLRQPDARGNRR